MIRTIKGDIIKMTDVQAIIKTAISNLLRGGGVKGAIHRTAGKNCSLNVGCLVAVKTKQSFWDSFITIP